MTAWIKVIFKAEDDIFNMILPSYQNTPLRFIITGGKLIFIIP